MPPACASRILIFQILKAQTEQSGFIFSEGVLEVLPEGFGFFRAPGFNYLPGPDDIYVSPSQIRTFDIQTGDIVSGQIRPPKESERFFALMKVEAVDFEAPDTAHDKLIFENLTPLFPQAIEAGDLVRQPLDSRPRPDYPIGKVHAAYRRAAAYRQDPADAKLAIQSSANHPEVYLFILLIDERPEEVTDMDVPAGRGHSSTFDDHPSATCRSPKWSSKRPAA